jgi:hypothetical protein
MPNLNINANFPCQKPFIRTTLLGVKRAKDKKLGNTMSIRTSRPSIRGSTLGISGRETGRLRSRITNGNRLRIRKETNWIMLI